MRTRIRQDFYLRPDVLTIARELLGKRLVSNIGGIITSGLISETEAYNGIIDRASHAYGNRRTQRTETMYRSGGIAYIYLCYGIHSLFNVVTNIEGIPHAVLIRSVIPCGGLDAMGKRIGRKVGIRDGIGPGRLTKLLGLKYTDNGEDLINSNKIWIEEGLGEVSDTIVDVTARIGVGYAAEDAELPYRFVLQPDNYGALPLADCEGL